MRTLILSAACLLLPLTAQADGPFNRWHCMENLHDAFQDTYDNGQLRVSNLRLTYGESFIGELPQIKLSVAAANYSNQKASLSVEVIAASPDDTPEFAISGEAGFGYVDAGASELVEATIFTTPESLAETQPGCLRMSVHFFN